MDSLCASKDVNPAPSRTTAIDEEGGVESEALTSGVVEVDGGD